MMLCTLLKVRSCRISSSTDKNNKFSKELLFDANKLHKIEQDQFGFSYVHNLLPSL